MNGYAKMIICYFDSVPMDVLGEYLAMHPKDINNLYSNMIDDKSYFRYKRLAHTMLDTKLLSNRLLRLERRRSKNVSQR